MHLGLPNAQFIVARKKKWTFPCQLVLLSLIKGFDVVLLLNDFFNNQSLSVHIKGKHVWEQSPSSGETDFFQEKEDESAAQVKAPSSVAELNYDRFDTGTNKIEKRRGNQRRTSCTSLFK